MTPKGTLYPLDDILKAFPDITCLDWWADLLPLQIEEEKFKETQDKLWAIYGEGPSKHKAMIDLMKPYQILYNVSQCHISQCLNNIPDSDVPECNILGGNDLPQNKNDNKT